MLNFFRSNKRKLELHVVTDEQIFAALSNDKIFYNWLGHVNGLKIAAKSPVLDISNMIEVKKIAKRMAGFIASNIQNLNAQQLESFQLLVRCLSNLLDHSSKIYREQGGYDESASLKVYPANYRKESTHALKAKRQVAYEASVARLSLDNIDVTLSTPNQDHNRNTNIR